MKNLVICSVLVAATLVLSIGQTGIIALGAYSAMMWIGGTATLYSAVMIASRIVNSAAADQVRRQDEEYQERCVGVCTATRIATLTGAHAKKAAARKRLPAVTTAATHDAPKRVGVPHKAPAQLPPPTAEDDALLRALFGDKVIIRKDSNHGQ